ncbi:hypothetical protein HDV05_008587 [Chytridiales sp. JEL 0842]|nr:hypothetical protein HDV05_008587 [Chytridiales sp. JEL 0842]
MPSTLLTDPGLVLPPPDARPANISHLLPPSARIAHVQVPLPHVFYQCHCQHQPPPTSSTKDDEAAISSNTSKTLSKASELVKLIETTPPPQPADYLTSFPLQKMYYCTHCLELRCSICLQEEIASYYCPNCLFEVPTASVKAEKNSTETHVITAVQYQKMENPIQTTEFESLRTHFEKVVRSEKPLASLSRLASSSGSTSSLAANVSAGLNLPKSLLASIPGLERLSRTSSLFASAASLAAGGNKEEVKAYVSETKLDGTVDEEEVQRMKNLKSLDEVTTLQQRFLQLENQPRSYSELKPQRIHLRTKKAKRCKTCEHVLVKPEPRAQNNKFTIMLVAMDNAPLVTILPSPHPIQLNEPSTIKLKFTNPLDQPITIQLATPNNPGTLDSRQENKKQPWGCCEVVFQSPMFTVPAFSEVGDYDDQPAQGGLPGVVVCAENTVTVDVKVVPKLGLLEVKEGGVVRVEFPMLVKYTRKVKDGLESSQEGGEVDHVSALWVFVGLGEVKV